MQRKLFDIRSIPFLLKLSNSKVNDVGSVEGTYSRGWGAFQIRIIKLLGKLPW